MDAAPSRALALAVARLTIDPRAERSSARALHNEVELVRYLEARARLRGRLMTPQAVPEIVTNHGR